MVQARLESSIVGRVLISTLIVVIVGGVGAWNLPESQLSQRAQLRVRPFINATGLDQTWSVFAPDPPRKELELEARIVYDDGTERTWRVPSRDPVLGAYGDYRWLKWAEWMTTGASVTMWGPAAAWIARSEQRAGRRPVSVSLVRQAYDLPIGEGRTAPQPFEFYTYPVPDPTAGSRR